jgi:hypothetical protein
VAVEVGAHRDDDADAVIGADGGEQQVEEALPLGRIGTEGEDLFELVHHDDGPGTGAPRVQDVGVGTRRVWSRGENADRGGRGMPWVGLLQAGDETGPQQGGLAAAGRACQHDEVVAPDQVDKLADELVPAEEAVAVARLEPGKTGIGSLRVVVGGAGLLGRVPRGLVPSSLPVVAVPAARLDIGEGHRQGGQPLTGRRLRERRRGVVRPPRHRPIGDPARLLTQLPQLIGELRDRTLGRVQRSLTTSHHTVPDQ